MSTPQLLNGTQLWELTAEALLILCGTLTTMEAQALVTSLHLVDGLDLPSSNTLEMPLFAELVLTRTGTHKRGLRVPREYSNKLLFL